MVVPVCKEDVNYDDLGHLSSAQLCALTSDLRLQLCSFVSCHCSWFLLKSVHVWNSLNSISNCKRTDTASLIAAVQDTTISGGRTFWMCDPGNGILSTSENAEDEPSLHWIVPEPSDWNLTRAIPGQICDTVICYSRTTSCSRLILHFAVGTALVAVIQGIL